MATQRVIDTGSSWYRYGRVLLLLCSLAVFAGAQAPEKQSQPPSDPATATSAATPIPPGQAEKASPLYYFISDMHIGGDAGLDKCNFEKELIAFLQKIAEGPQPAELIIVGDAFGMWELTDVSGMSKLAHIASTHADLFAQFRETGKRVKITLIPGNHDYDLACVPAYKAELAQWNIVLEPAVHITREVAGRKIWIEHGNQHDSFNRFPDFGNRFGLPAGYFITTQSARRVMISASGTRSFPRILLRA